MSQQARYGEMGVQRHHAVADEGRVLFGGVGMSQSMKGNAPVRCGGVHYLGGRRAGGVPLAAAGGGETEEVRAVTMANTS